MDKTILFVFSLGRSGTKSIATKLGLLHERDGSNCTIEKMKERIRTMGDFYGEISHYHMKMIPEIKETFGNDALFIHLVRDGRKTVDSFNRMERLDTTGITLGLHKILPGFNEMPRFERICWMWKYWNEEADKHIPIRIRIEDLANILPQLHVSHNKPITYQRFFPKKPWTKEEHETFNRICEALMKKYGYE